MISMPLNDIIAKIKEKTNLSETEINSKIKAKLDQLSGLISKEGAGHIVANELGVKLFEQTSGKLQIKNILSGMRDVETVGKLIRKFDAREFKVNGRDGKVANIILGDETGTVRVVCWGSKADEISKAKEGDIIKIKSGYIRENNGSKEIHMNDRSSVIINPDGEKIDSVAETKRPDAVRMKIQNLNDNSSNVELFGTIVQSFEPRFFEVCPTCNKRLKQDNGVFYCEEHKHVPPNYSYVMNIVLDDGTETIRAVFFREQVLKLLNKTKDEIMAYKNEPGSFETIKNDLLGKQIKIKGRTSKNAMFDRLEFVTNDVDINPDPQEEMKILEQQK
jgi:replication factor A1